MDRVQKAIILEDLKKKMVFLVGPRQVGKTWLAKNIAKDIPGSIYLNYDHMADRKIINNESWIESTQLVIFDEIHKMKNWKNYLKGIFDTKTKHLQMLVTGSARLDTFRKSGDSLAGRFFAHRLLPFSPAELTKTKSEIDLEQFMKRGGFPEPYLTSNDASARRWRLHYRDGLIRQDILDFERVHDFKALRLVFDLLRSRVGSPVSYSSISRDVGVSPNTVKKYIRIFQDLFIVFSVHPHSRNIARSIQKEPKIYFFDNGLVHGNEGAIFENFVAICLLKETMTRTDQLGYDYELCYLKTKEGKEVDFCITCDTKPEILIEAKKTRKDISSNLRYFSNKYNIPGIQIVQNLKHEFKSENIEVRRAKDYLETLFL